MEEKLVVIKLHIGILILYIFSNSALAESVIERRASYMLGIDKVDLDLNIHSNDTDCAIDNDKFKQEIKKISYQQTLMCTILTRKIGKI